MPTANRPGLPAPRLRQLGTLLDRVVRVLVHDEQVLLGEEPGKCPQVR